MALLVLIAAALLVALTVYRRIDLYLRFRALRLRDGCAAPRCDVWEGLDVQHSLRMYRSAQQHTLLDYFAARWAAFGTTFQERTLFRTSICTLDPENVKAVLGVRFSDYEIGWKRHRAFRPFMGHGIFTTDGDPWSRNRALLRPNFVKRRIADLASLERHVQNLFACIPADFQTVDLAPLLSKFTMDASTELLFGTSVHTLTPAGAASSHAFADAFDVAMQTTTMRGILGFPLDLLPNPTFDAAYKTIASYTDRFVDMALEFRKEAAAATTTDTKDGSSSSDDESNPSRYTFLRELAKQTGDRREIRDHVLNLLVAGKDTTSLTMSWIVWALARYKNVCANLRAEIAPLNGNPPSFNQLREMNYLRYFIYEVLRLYPVIPINIRCAVKDTVLPVGGGKDGAMPLFVPRGAFVFYSVRDMHRRTDLYGPDAESFRPERWEGRLHGWDFLPFNGGPRICLGQQFAMAIMSYTVVRLLQRYGEIESRDPSPPKEKMGITMSNLNGALVGLK